MSMKPIFLKALRSGRFCSLYSCDDYLQLSGIQHFAFCKRQWALIHIEKIWVDNNRTAQGNAMHRRCHDAKLRDKRGDVIVVRGLDVSSLSLGVKGTCDVVEFHKSESGVKLAGEAGSWVPFPVEYKNGRPKEHDADRLQLCAQAMCMEEMLKCSIQRGALFYGELKHREDVFFNHDLRQQVIDCVFEMHRLFDSGITPEGNIGRSCYACSLKDYCLPELALDRCNAIHYLEHVLEE